METDRPTWNLSRRLVGWAWLVAWVLLLHGVHSPWKDLGGLADERLRWLERLVLGLGCIVGFTIGRTIRGWRPRVRASHLDLLRYVFLPPSALAAFAVVVADRGGQPDHVGVVLSGFVAYWAGLDVSIAALPLMRGCRYRPTVPLEPDVPDVPEPNDDRWD